MWRKKRETILIRDEHKCVNCGRSTKPLHVHHLCYCGDPWEVEDHALQTLCPDCHLIEHANIAPAERDLIDDIRFLEYSFPGLNKKINSIIIQRYNLKKGVDNG